MAWCFYLDQLPKLVVVGSNPIARSILLSSCVRLESGDPQSVAQGCWSIQSRFHDLPITLLPSLFQERDPVMMHKQMLVLCVAAFLGGVVGGVLSSSSQLFSPTLVGAQKPNGVNAEEFLLRDARGNARAGLGLDANGEVGLVLRSKDGRRTLTLSPDDPSAIKLVEQGGRVLWGAP